MFILAGRISYTLMLSTKSSRGHVFSISPDLRFDQYWPIISDNNPLCVHHQTRSKTIRPITRHCIHNTRSKVPYATNEELSNLQKKIRLSSLVHDETPQNPTARRERKFSCLLKEIIIIKGQARYLSRPKGCTKAGVLFCCLCGARKLVVYPAACSARGHVIFTSRWSMRTNFTDATEPTN